MPLLTAHLGIHVVGDLEDEGHRASHARTLDLIVKEPTAAPDLRLEAACAIARLTPEHAENVFAELALDDGLSEEQRIGPLTKAFEAADSVAATAALQLLLRRMEA